MADSWPKIIVVLMFWIDAVTLGVGSIGIELMRASRDQNGLGYDLGRFMFEPRLNESLDSGLVLVIDPDDT